MVGFCQGHSELHKLDILVKSFSFNCCTGNPEVLKVNIPGFQIKYYNEMIVDLKLQVADNMKSQPVELPSHTGFPSLEEPECNILV